MEYMDLLPPTAPSLVFARETCTPYYHLETLGGKRPRQTPTRRAHCRESRKSAWLIWKQHAAAPNHGTLQLHSDSDDDDDDDNGKLISLRLDRGYVAVSMSCENKVRTADS